VNCLPTFLCL